MRIFSSVQCQKLFFIGLFIIMGIELILIYFTHSPYSKWAELTSVQGKKYVTCQLGLLLYSLIRQYLQPSVSVRSNYFVHQKWLQPRYSKLPTRHVKMDQCFKSDPWTCDPIWKPIWVLKNNLLFRNPIKSTKNR